MPRIVGCLTKSDYLCGTFFIVALLLGGDIDTNSDWWRFAAVEKTETMEEESWIIEMPAEGSVAQHRLLRLRDPFFRAAEHADLLGGDVVADVDLTPSGPHWRIRMHCHGSVRTLCDRCMTEMTLDVDDSYEAPLLPSCGGEVPAGDDTDAIYFDPACGTVNLLRPLADTLALSLGLTHTHRPGECDPQMEQELLRCEAEANTPLADALAQLSADKPDDDTDEGTDGDTDASAPPDARK